MKSYLSVSASHPRKEVLSTGFDMNEKNVTICINSIAFHVYLSLFKRYIFAIRPSFLFIHIYTIANYIYGTFPREIFI